MRLWTWQTPDHSLLGGCVVPERSEYVLTAPGLLEAYQELASRLGTDQLVWCCTLPSENWRLTERIEWVLDVPSRNVLGFVDDIVWNRIFKRQCTLPDSIRHSWMTQAIQLFGY